MREHACDPIGITGSRRETRKIVAPGIFIVLPFTERIDALHAQAPGRDGNILDLGEPGKFSAHRRLKEVIKILPPSRIGGNKIVCREIVEPVFKDRTSRRELYFAQTILLLVPVRRQPTVPFHAPKNLVPVRSALCDHIDDTRHCISIFGVESPGIDCKARDCAFREACRKAAGDDILNGKAVDQKEKLCRLSSPDVPLKRCTRLERNNLPKRADRKPVQL